MISLWIKNMLLANKLLLLGKPKLRSLLSTKSILYLQTVECVCQQFVQKKYITIQCPILHFTTTGNSLHRSKITLFLNALHRNAPIHIHTQHEQTRVVILMSYVILSNALQQNHPHRYRLITGDNGTFTWLKDKPKCRPFVQLTATIITIPCALTEIQFQLKCGLMIATTPGASK